MRQLRERLLSRLIIDPDTGCLLWTGPKNTKGYGLMKVGRDHRMVHRLMYEMFAGPIPEGLQLDHLCRVRRCASVAHLEAVTCRENLLRSPFTAPSMRAAQTHCINGHLFDEANTYRTPRGQRSCRTCARAAWRANHARQATTT